MIEDSDLHIGAVIEREASMSEEINKLKSELERIKGNPQSRYEDSLLVTLYLSRVHFYLETSSALKKKIRLKSINNSLSPSSISSLIHNLRFSSKLLKSHAKKQQ